MCLTGLGCVECELDVKGLNRVGLKREVETRLIRFPSEVYNEYRSKEKQALARKFIDKEKIEKDGWKVDVSSVSNSHKYVYSAKHTIEGINIVFTRFVDPETRLPVE